MKYLLALFVVLLAGCQTPGIVLKETPLGISETRKVIVSIAGEPRSISQNGRELVSKYYDRDGLFIQRMEKAYERFYSHFIILGDRRPYDIAIKVHREIRKDGGGFEFIEQDLDRGELLAERLKAALNESRDKRNLLDDFRSF
ncbi:MAG: hypothetical protein ACLGGX_01935 [Bdellovibrionia bacterium]